MADPCLHAYFETALFRAEVDEADTESAVLGRDCLDWLRAHLADAVETGEPVQEDFGWVLSVTSSGQKLWLMLQKWHTTELGWHVWIEPRGLVGHLLKARSSAAALDLCSALDRVLESEPRIHKLRWVRDPRELEFE